MINTLPVVCFRDSAPLLTGDNIFDTMSVEIESILANVSLDFTVWVLLAIPKLGADSFNSGLFTTL